MNVETHCSRRSLVVKGDVDEGRLSEDKIARDASPGQDQRNPHVVFAEAAFLYGGEIMKPTAVTPMSTRAGNQIASATRPGGDCRRVSQ